MINSSFLDQRIAIFDDRKIGRERLSDLVKYTGNIPVPVPNAPALSDFNKFLSKEKISLIICDHRLFECGDYADYTGAKAIAAGYRCHYGGILVTAYEGIDIESSIREYRRWIPSLIHSNNLDPETMIKALEIADREARENIPCPERIAYRTLMTVRRIINTGTGPIVKVIMSQWRINEEVGFPLSMVPSKMRSETEPGKMIIAKVNVGANNASDLYFDEFEMPDPDVLRNIDSNSDNS